MAGLLSLQVPILEQHVQEAIRNENLESVSISMERLIIRVANDKLLNETILTSAVSLIKETAVKYHFISDILLHHLHSFHNPKPLIDIIPALFCFHPSYIIKKVIVSLQKLSYDDKNLISVINAVSNLPIPLDCLHIIDEIVTDAFSKVMKLDLPCLLRCIFKIHQYCNLDNILNKIFQMVSRQ